jgi:hypothetical protein
MPMINQQSTRNGQPWPACVDAAATEEGEEAAPEGGEELEWVFHGIGGKRL